MLRPKHAAWALSLILLSGCTSAGTGTTAIPAPVSTTSPPPSTTAAVSATWVRTFTGPRYGAFFDFTLTPEGNVLVVGATNHLHQPPYSGDALLVELNLTGDTLWERTWGGDGYEQAIAVAPAPDGGYYIFGETDSYGAGDRDFFLLAIDGDGAERWHRTYGGEGREWPYGMLTLSNHDLLIHGFSEHPGGSDRDPYALRVRPDGEVVWESAGYSADEEIAIDALETPEGALVLAVVAGEDGELVRLDADGNLLWVRRYELPGWQYFSQIAPADSEGFILSGFSMTQGPPQQADTWLARANATGELEWETTFGDPAFDDYATSLIRLRDGTYLIGAIADGILLTCVDGDGEIRWRRSPIGESVHGAMALVELDQGGYLVAGLIQLVPGRSYDAILLRTDPSGALAE